MKLFFLLKKNINFGPGLDRLLPFRLALIVMKTSFINVSYHILVASLTLIRHQS